MTRHYSAWIQFDDPDLTAAINTAAELGGIEHLDEVEIGKVASAALENSLEFTVTLPADFSTSEASKHSYYQCVYLLFDDKHTVESLNKLHAVLRKAIYEQYNREFKGVNRHFMPHISVAYGDWDQEKKQHVVDALRRDNLKKIALKTHRVREILIADTPLDKSPAEWRILHRIQLARRD